MEGCKHNMGTDAHHDHSVCKTCGAVLTDGGWGVASRKWFPNIEEAKFYKQHGRHSDSEIISMLCGSLAKSQAQANAMKSVLIRISLADRYTWEKDGTDIFEAFREIARETLAQIDGGASNLT